jgi:uncharacterized Zn-finger protein
MSSPMSLAATTNRYASITQAKYLRCAASNHPQVFVSARGRAKVKSCYCGKSRSVENKCAGCDGTGGTTLVACVECGGSGWKRG